MIDFDNAKTWHKIFALHVAFVADGIQDSKLDPRVVGDEAQCELGKWLRGEGSRYAHLPSYVELNARHKDFHDVAGVMLKEHLAGESGIALELQSSQFLTASDAVIVAIEALESDVRPADSADPRAHVRELAYRSKQIWKESFRVGMGLIDYQHEEVSKLIEKLNQAPTATVAAKSYQETKAALDRFAALHFESEELFMHRVKFPAQLMASHIAEHKRLLDFLATQNHDAVPGKPMMASDAYANIKREIANHIENFDMAFRDYVGQAQNAHAPERCGQTAPAVTISRPERAECAATLRSAAS